MSSAAKQQSNIFGPIRNIFTLFKREFASYFNSMTAYVVMGAFVVIMGAFFWFMSNTAINTGTATMQDLFRLAPIFLMVLTPLITMRSFAEELSNGTFELIATRPVTDFQILIGKYLAANILVLLTLLPTLLYFITLNKLAFPVGEVDGAFFSVQETGNESWLPLDRLDNGPIIGAYLGLLGLGTIFTGIGIFASTLTDNVIVAFIIGILLNLVFFLGFQGLAQIEFLDGVGKIGILYHFISIQKGVLDSRDVAYFVSFDIVVMLFAKIVLTLRKR